MKLAHKTYSCCLLMAFVLCSSCAQDKNTTPTNLTPYQQEVVDYFKDVALGFEFGGASEVTRKWGTDMKIFVGGDESPALKAELDDIISEINALTTDDFDISITTDTTQSNCYVFFGAGEDFADVYPGAASEIENNWGLFYTFFNGAEEMYRAVVYVDIYRATDVNAQKHLLREELTQSLGLAKDSEEYPESIFQSDWTTVTEYMPIDRDLVRLLYHPSMETGLDASSVDPLLRELAVELNLGQ